MWQHVEVSSVAHPAVASHCPGRLRLRDRAWRGAPTLAAIAQAANSADGVLDVVVSDRVGSVLIHYDPDRLAPAALEARLAPLLGPAVPEGGAAARPAAAPARAFAWPTVSPAANRASKIAMTASMALSLAALGVGKRLHAAAGGLSLAFLAVHLLHHRRKLWR